MVYFLMKKGDFKMTNNVFYDRDDDNLEIDHIKEVLHRIADYFGDVPYRESLEDLEEITKAINDCLTNRNW